MTKEEVGEFFKTTCIEDIARRVILEVMGSGEVSEDGKIQLTLDILDKYKSALKGLNRLALYEEVFKLLCRSDFGV